MMRRQLANKSDLLTYIGMNGENNEVNENNKFNPTNSNIIWEILCIDKNGNLDLSCKNEFYIIRHSVKTELYFKNIDLIREAIEKEIELVTVELDVLQKQFDEL